MRTSDPVIDCRKQVLFSCSGCGSPLTHDDFFELGLRLPDSGESRDEYCESELIDDVSHTRCLRSRAS